MNKIRFICVNFNNHEYSKDLLRSLEIQDGRSVDFSLECIVVDNSTDEQDSKQCEVLTSQYSWVTYVRTHGNLGYFGGINYGLGMIDKADAEFVVICNNDLQFEGEFCDKLLKKRYRSETFAVCPNVVTADGLHQNPHIPRPISGLRRFQFDLYFSHYYVSRFLLMILRVIRPVKSSRAQPSTGCEIHMGVGACYVLTREFFKRFEKLNYPFFLYGEEAYLSEQIHSKGGVVWYDPNLRVHHAESASTSKVPTRTTYEMERTGYPDYRRLM